MRHLSISLLYISIALISCTEKHDDDTGTRTIKININKKKDFIELSNYFDAEIVCLETNADCQIGQIDKVKTTDQYIFVLDKTVARAVFLFDKKGKFVRKFDKKGKGQGEYLYLENMDVYENHLYILSGLDRKILQYNYHTGNFAKETRLNSHGGYELKVLPDQDFFTIRANSILRIDFWNSKGKLTNTVLDEKFSYVHWSANKAISSIGKENFICPPFGNMIYKVNKSTVSPDFCIDFLNNNLPLENISNKDEFNKAINSRKYSWVTSFSLSNKYLLFEFASKNWGFGIYDILSEIVEIGNVFIYDGTLVSSIVGEFDDGFVLSQEAPFIFKTMTFFQEHDLNDKYPIALQNIKINDNPVLFFLNNKQVITNQ